MTLEDIVRRFEATRSGSGYMAHCPVREHKDNTASLSIDQDGDHILLYCFAGCAPEDIVGAKGLTMKDLFVTTTQRSPIIATYYYRDLKGEAR
jgi:putative DNA primase/helicase